MNRRFMGKLPPSTKGMMNVYNKIEFLDDGENMEDSKIIRKDRKLLTGDAAVPYLFLGIVFLIVGATLYNKGLY